MKIFKALPGKGDLSEKENIIKLASDYTDPYDAVMDLMPESEIDLKKKYRAGGIVK